MKTTSSAVKKGSIFFVMVVGSALTMIAQRFLTFHFGTFTQSFYRCLAGSLSLFLVAYLFFRADLTRTLKDRSLWKEVFIFAAVNVLVLVFMVEGIARTSATLASLFQNLGVFLTIIATYLVFENERKIRSRSRFITGIVLSLIGAVGLVLAKKNLTFEYSLGTAYLFLLALMLPVNGILTKRISHAGHPICVGALTTLAMAAILFFLGLLKENLGQVAGAPAFVNLALFGSGVLGILCGFPLAFLVVRLSGIVVLQIFTLVIPVFTFLLSYLLLREHLNPVETVMGAILLFGCYLGIREHGS